MSDNGIEALGLRRAPDGGALIIDGKLVSQSVLAEVAAKAAELAKLGVRPGLAVVLVGEDPASQVYVKSKGKAAETCGFHSIQHTLPATTSRQSRPASFHLDRQHAIFTSQIPCCALLAMRQGITRTLKFNL